MPERIPQSTAKLVVFRAIQSADHLSPATGKTIAIKISKNGANAGNPNAGATNATEIATGWVTGGYYKFTLDTTDTGTLGPVAWEATGTGIDPVGDVYEVIAPDAVNVAKVNGYTVTGAGTSVSPWGP